jgi:hypothetical protein
MAQRHRGRRVSSGFVLQWSVCTVTWFDAPDGYELFFNRDELTTRKPEISPQLRTREGVRFIAPADGDHGGTWIAVNEFGLSLCILNGSPAPGARPALTAEGRTSRGLLPLALVAAPDGASVAGALGRLDLEPYRPFALLALEPNGSVLLASWSLTALVIEPRAVVVQPVVSSSFCTREVRQSRAAVFRRIQAEPGEPLERHLRFHASHAPEAGPHSPCMHRAEAQTVSFSRVHVARSSIGFHYSGRAPCLGPPAGEPLRLARNPGSLAGGR